MDRRLCSEEAGRDLQVQEALGKEAASSAARSAVIPALMWKHLSLQHAS
uniref:Uncharacterized protein n=1 Tax=Anguilla anguilla TaxID=7936 RepID=A0A0E9PFN0_ANGAN